MPPLPVTAAQALLTSVGNQAKALLSPDNNPLFDPAGFIATEDPVPVISRPAKQLARAACRAWARQPVSGNNPAADRLYAGVCGEYLDSIGEGVDPGKIGPPFSGGQCPGTAYNITWEQRTQAPGGGFQWTARSRIAPGLIGPLRIVNNSLGTTCPTGQFESRESIVGFDGGGATLLGTGGCGDQQPGYRNLVATPRSGGPNNCGDPPPDYVRPRPPIVLPPVTPIFIDLPDIGPVQVNVNVDAEGLITVESPTLDVEVNIGAPGGDDGGGGGVGPDDLVPDGGTPGGAADTGNGGAAAGTAPAGQELVGVRVEVLEAPIGANTYDRVAVTAYRGVGYVRMGYPGRLALDMGGAALISPQFFLAPVRGLTAWEVRANNGFIARVTPYYRELPT